MSRRFDRIIMLLLGAAAAWAALQATWSVMAMENKQEAFMQDHTEGGGTRLRIIHRVDEHTEVEIRMRQPSDRQDDDHLMQRARSLLGHVRAAGRDFLAEEKGR